MKYCLKCGEEVENDDNFCPKCGHWTAKGYSFLKDKENLNVINGKITKQSGKLFNLFILLFFSMLLFLSIIIYRRENILKPFIFIKRQVMSYKYGYNATVLKTNNQYFNLNISDLEIAKDKIKEDFSKQKWQCKDNFEIGKIENNLEKKHNIISVDFCDMPINEAYKIASVIDKMYDLFPNIKNYLTNISITNSLNKSDYVAYFQPIYQFVNSTNDINNYNKVNKTQILLNSYYFINDDVLKKPVKDNWYVKDTTWESLIAHEFGHYILFVKLLKNKNIDNVLFVTKENKNSIDDVIDIIDSETYSKEIVLKALDNYNNKYKENYSLFDFNKSISNYAASSNNNGDYTYNEVIAESIHDYYLHGNSANKTSLEIVSILK